MNYCENYLTVHIINSKPMTNKVTLPIFDIFPKSSIHQDFVSRCPTFGAMPTPSYSAVFRIEINIYNIYFANYFMKNKILEKNKISSAL